MGKQRLVFLEIVLAPQHHIPCDLRVLVHVGHFLVEAFHVDVEGHLVRLRQLEAVKIDDTLL
jgi:hypothetical protein